MHLRCLLLLLGAALSPLPAAAAEVNLYSARQEALIRPLLDRFTEATGIQVRLVSGEADALLKRLQSEGRNSPADLFLTVDVGRLHLAKEAGVLQPVSSPLLEEAVPPGYRDPEAYWYGLSLRSRVFVYAPERVDRGELSSYEDLADPKWKGRLCVRSSGNIYNQSLVASLIAHDGEAAAEAWARGLVANFARPPMGGDRDQIKAVAAGQCDLALVNTYYLGGMLNSPDAAERAAAEQVRLFWPNQDSRGAHVNISGAGVTRSAPNRDQALRLLEFLVGEEAQRWYAEDNYEYPVREGVAVSATLAAWGEFRTDPLPLGELARHHGAALRLMDRAGWR